MSDIHPLIQWVARLTEATEADLREVRRRLVERGVLSGPTRDLLGVAARQSPAEVRLRPRNPAPVRRWRWVGAWALVATAAAAGFLGWFARAPAPLPEPTTLSLTLEAPDQDQATQPTRDVALTFQGHGHVDGRPQMPRIAWERGRLDVEVTPGKGIDLWVVTREARIRVVGTGFSVSRDENGTTVVVRHGTVEVRCGGQVPVLVQADGSQVCGPVSAAALLGKARVMQSQGALPDDLLPLAEAARAAATEGTAVYGEAVVLQFEVLARLERAEEALQAADAYLTQSQKPREEEVRRMAVDLAFRAGGCERARGYGSMEGCGR